MFTEEDYRGLESKRKRNITVQCYCWLKVGQSFESTRIRSWHGFESKRIAILSWPNFTNSKNINSISRMHLFCTALFIFARDFLSYLFVPPSFSFSFSFFFFFIFAASGQSSSSWTFLQFLEMEENALSRNQRGEIYRATSQDNSRPTFQAPRGKNPLNYVPG